MATDSHRDSFQLPAPPPALHTRGSDMGRPGTPSQEAFTSPQQTPQGSPSKSHHPPGAFDLPHVFENAMRLLPTMGSPSKSKPGTPTSPNKAKLQTADADPFSSDVTTLTPGSPTRKANKENTPPTARPGLQKESSFLNHAAQSRQEPYRPREDQSTRYYPSPQRLTTEELEKARKPAVKRLANVTQLCKCHTPVALTHLTCDRLPRLLLRPPHLRAHPPEPPITVQGAESAASRHARGRVQRRTHAVPRPRACQPPQATHTVTTG
jgi:cell cycle protein kinase DBF2